MLVENSLHVTGAFQSALRIACALRASHDVELVIPTSSKLRDAVIAQGLTCHTLPMIEIGRSFSRISRYLPTLAINGIRLRRLLNERKIDLLWVNDYYNLTGVVARLFGWRGRLFSAVRLMPSRQQPVLNWVWSTLAVRCSERVIAVSRAVADELPSNSAVTVLHDPINLNEHYPDSIGRGNGSDGAVRCLYLANYIAGKGQQDGLESFAAAYSQNSTLRLRFVGSDMGLDKNRELKAALQRRVLDLGLGAAVQVADATDDIEGEIKAADMLLNFSHSESFSNTCAEASFYGRPVIATLSGGPAEVIVHGTSGLLIQIGDLAAMRDAILQLAADAKLRKQMGAAGRTLVRSRFTTAGFVRQFEELVSRSPERAPC